MSEPANMHHSDSGDFTGGSPLSRRDLLMRSAGAVAAAGAAGRLTAAEDKGSSKRHGAIHQSIVHWCFAKYWDVPQMIKVAKQLGCESIELISPEHFPLLKKNGLTCAIASIDMSPAPPFVNGPNDTANHPRVIAETKKSIDACAEYGFPNVIAFTGMKEDISDEEGLKNCVKCFKELVGYAEKKKVTICIEMLNTRDDSHPMKGHPGYHGDSLDYCQQIIDGVGSERMKLLFDIYHVQIMHGDVIRRLRQLKEYLGHIHTAGNPGRGELDGNQEINYPAIMKALVDIGYDGYVGQEFIPTRDPLQGLRAAVEQCDVPRA